MLDDLYDRFLAAHPEYAGDLMTTGWEDMSRAYIAWLVSEKIIRPETGEKGRDMMRRVFGGAARKN